MDAQTPQAWLCNNNACILCIPEQRTAVYAAHQPLPAPD